ncbi:hypothetical protein Tco_1155158 [Tanacetum coccineum]
MIAIRMKKFYNENRKKSSLVDGKTPVGFDKRSLNASLSQHCKGRIRWVADNGMMGLSIGENILKLESLKSCIMAIRLKL